MVQKIYIRRGTKAELDGIILESGEPGWTTDTNEFYMGDGITSGGVFISGSETGVDSINTLVGTVTISGSSGILVTTSGQFIIVEEASLDVDSINTLTGEVTLSGMGGIGITEEGQVVVISGNDIDTFLELIDTPASYAGKALQSVRVNEAEDGLEIADSGSMVIHGNEYHNPDFVSQSDFDTHEVAITGIHGVGAYILSNATSTPVTLYVDAASGNDSNLGTSGSPKATIKGALDTLPTTLVHSINICVRGQQNYSESNAQLAFDRFNILTTMAIRVVNSNDEPMYDHGITTSGTSATLIDTTKSWAINQFANAYVWLYAGTGAGQIQEISSNTATEVAVSGWVTTPDDTSYYTIGGGATLTGTGTRHVYFSKGRVHLYGFKHTGATSNDVYSTNFSYCNVYYNYFANSVIGIYIQRSTDISAYYNYYDATGAGTRYGIRLLQASAWPRASVFCGGTYGISLERMSIAQMSNTALKNWFMLCTTGIRLEDGSGAMAASSQGFATGGDACGTNIDPSTSTTEPRWWT